MTIHWSRLAAHALSPAQLYAILALRAEIFVVEQHCAYQDVDGRDLLEGTHHVTAWRADRLVACLRLYDRPPGGPQPAGEASPPRSGPGHGMPPEGEADGCTVIGRVAVAIDERGRGLGHELMRRGLRAAFDLWPRRSVHLSAQAHLQGFYAAHGFRPVTAPYLEDGIPHVGMARPA